MSEDFLSRAKMALHDMQGRVEGGKLAMFQRTIEYAEALQAERDAAVDALYAVELEYDPSEGGLNALKMYEIAFDAMNTIRARSNGEPGQ